jgi:hydroxypyruvate isomerase
MTWSLPYTLHLGYRPPEYRPQFAATVGSLDPVAHVRYAAKLGMRGVLYPWAATRPAEEVRAVAQALREYNLINSAVLALPEDSVRFDAWSDDSLRGRRAIEQIATRTAELAVTLQSTTLAVLLAYPADATLGDKLSRRVSWERSVGSVAQLAAIAADRGLRVGIEPLLSIEAAMLRSTQDAVDFVKQVAAPNVGIIYDTGHVASMGEDSIQALGQCARYLERVQFADQPGRVEPGGGALPIVDVALELSRVGYSGLVDLEHGWTEDTADGERVGLDRLRAFDAAVAAGRASPSVPSRPITHLSV